MRIGRFLLLAVVACLAFTFGCSDDKDEDVCDQTSIIYGPSVEHGGETYQSVVICGQTWLKRNLNYVVSNSKCGSGSYPNSSLSDANTTACDTYGRLYDWATSMALPSNCNYDSCPVQSKHQGICPVGWHVPNYAEWKALETAVGGVAKLKAKIGWDNNDNGTDDFGFSALPGGFGSSGSFVSAGRVSSWWSTDEAGISTGGINGDCLNAWSYGIGLGTAVKKGFNSVRCIKD